MSNFEKKYNFLVFDAIATVHNCEFPKCKDFYKRYGIKNYNILDLKNCRT